MKTQNNKTTLSKEEVGELYTLMDDISYQITCAEESVGFIEQELDVLRGRLKELTEEE